MIFNIACKKFSYHKKEFFSIKMKNTHGRSNKINDISRRCQSNEIEQKSQSNQSKTIERDRIIAIRLSNAIESKILGKIRFCSISFDCVRICSIGFEFVRLIASSVTLVHRQSTRYDPLFRRILSPPQGLPALVRFSVFKNRQIRHVRTTHITNHIYHS